MMIHPSQKLVILGGGTTGLTVAWKLSRRFPGQVILLEKEPSVGGLASTFARNGFSFDTGSHRLHDGYHPEVDELVADLCGPDLVRRDRKGLIYLKDRPLRYPPSALDIMFAFGLRDFLRFSADFLRARLRQVVWPEEARDFEEFTTQKVGRSLYERFYKPYALKLYGMSPRALARDPAESRVRKFRLSAVWRDVRNKLAGKRGSHYLYPARGIGQLSAALEKRCVAHGGQLLFISQVDRLHLEEGRRVRAVSVTTQAGESTSFETGVVVSTIPLDALHALLRREHVGNSLPPLDLRWRALRLLYLVTGDRLPSDNETFYFPEEHVLFGRVSELNKYSPALNPDPSRAVLTVEIPCSEDDAIWSMSDEQLTRRCVAGLQRFGILRQPLTTKVEGFSRKLKNVYPVYDLGWKERFERIYQGLNRIENLYMIGRSALFLHCNIDHCMLMALKLAQHLSNGHQSKDRWENVRKDFFHYRVRE